MAKDVSKSKSIKRAKTITELVISAVIIAICGYAVKTAANNVTTVGDSPYVDNNAQVTESSSDASAEADDPDKIIFENLNVSTKDKFKGDLILVNEDHQYFNGDENLVVINERLDAEGRTSYRGNDNNVQTRENVYTALSRMIDDFSSSTGITDILIESAFRTNEQQQQLYDDDLAATGNDVSDRVALPGHSEHECGYALDFGINDAERDYDGSGEYDWINQNCWKYGFILRYAENKTDITKIKYESWHYRYVGTAHAYYMYKNGLCLEEYIDLLKNYPYEGEHLKFSDDNGTEYEIYYSPSDDSSENTIVPVPSGYKYDITGNNVDGFIVTVYNGENSAPAEDTSSAETSSESSSEPENAGGDDNIDAGQDENNGDEL